MNQDESPGLHRAVTLNNPELIKKALKNCDDIDAEDSSGDTALLKAVKLDKFIAVKMLLNANADVRVSDALTGKTALEILVTRNWREVVASNLMNNLRRRNFKPRALAKLLVRSNCPMDYVLKMGDCQVSSEFLDCHPTMSLYSAMTKRDLNNIHFHLRYGRTDNIFFFYKYLSSFFTSTDMMESWKFCIEHLSDWNAIAFLGIKHLAYMFAVGKVEYLRVLLDCKIDILVRQKYGKDLQAFMIGNPYSYATELLRYKDLYVNTTGTKKQVALFFAVTENLRSNVRLILDLGTDVNSRNSNGLPCLFYPVCQNYIDVGKILLQYGADVQVVINDKGWTLFELAQDCKSIMFELLIAQLAISHVQGLPIKQVILDRINRNKDCKNFFDAYCQQLQELKTFKVVEAVTFFDVLCGRIESLYRIIRDNDILSSLKQYKYQHKLHSLYYSTIKTKLKQISNLYRFSRRIAYVISKSTEQFVDFDHLVVRNISDHLNHKDIIDFLTFTDTY